MKKFVLIALLGCGDPAEEVASAPAPAPAPAPVPPATDQGEEVFNTRCMVCHTIGAGDTLGPDLAGVTERRSEEWLEKWMADPIAMGQNDPIGVELMEKYTTQMPPQNLTEQEHQQVFAYISSKSGAE